MQGCSASSRWHRGRHPRHHVGLVHDVVQQIMGRQAHGPPAAQQALRTRQRCRRCFRGHQQSGQPRAARLGGALRQPQQVTVVRGKDGTAQGARQAQVMAGRGQDIEHRGQVLGHRRVSQGQAFGHHMRNAGLRQRVGHQRQHAALARQHHDLARQQTMLAHQLANRRRDPRCLLRAQDLFGLQACLGEGVAPDRQIAVRGFFAGAQDAGKAQHLPGLCGSCGVRAVRAPAVQPRRVLKNRIECVNHRRGIAPRVVALQHAALQTVGHKFARCFKDLGLGATETVDALLGVADDEQGQALLPAGTAASPGVRRQPSLKNLPLLWVGVLELVDQHVAQALVQPLLHPAGHTAVAQQGLRSALQV